MPGCLKQARHAPVRSSAYKASLIGMGAVCQDAFGELQAFNKPDVQAAIMEITANPMAMMKYQQNPEVMQVSLNAHSQHEHVVSAMQGLKNTFFVCLKVSCNLFRPM